ncbi:hypothetical protein [Bathymodiolus heckerae thiotrophic gill symbiont]|uniref:hypothetical protein n=1 Tax=Bathymodiolus heckerae thiotrophic gill symbiont TaxID=1052212 RepID=UPI0010FE164A|nr:hypothetical protein [Bathymodiolus heckerae thiotrophic gill symbiont]
MNTQQQILSELKTLNSNIATQGDMQNLRADIQTISKDTKASINKPLQSYNYPSIQAIEHTDDFIKIKKQIKQNWGQFFTGVVFVAAVSIISENQLLGFEFFEVNIVLGIVGGLFALQGLKKFNNTLKQRNIEFNRDCEPKIEHRFDNDIHITHRNDNWDELYNPAYSFLGQNIHHKH